VVFIISLIFIFAGNSKRLSRRIKPTTRAHNKISGKGVP